MDPVSFVEATNKNEVIKNKLTNKMELLKKADQSASLFTKFFFYWKAVIKIIANKKNQSNYFWNVECLFYIRSSLIIIDAFQK